MENIISVIVVTYNQEDTIGRTLDSILAQKCHLPIEIVIGEDCSTDSTRHICESYAQRFPHVIHLMPQTPNKGVIDNYFDCLLECKGKYIADCAGDDFWIDAEKLEKEVYVMEKNPSITVVHTNWQYYNETDGTTKINKTLPFPERITNGKEMLEAIITQTKAPVIHTCTSLYRAETIRKCYDNDTELFRNKDYGCEDVQLTFMLAYSGNVAFLPDVTLNYSIGHTSISTQPNEKKQFKFVRQTANLSYVIAQKYNIHTPTTRLFFTQKVFALLMHAFRSKDKQLRDEALKCMRAWKVEPNYKINAAKLIMSNSILWNLTLVLRHLFTMRRAIANIFK